MKRILLDTNILIDWLRGYRSSRPKSDQQRYQISSAKSLLESFVQADTEICISCHTVKELLQYPNLSEQEHSRIINMLPLLLTVLPTTHEVAKIAGFMARQSHEYRNHHIEDCYIAATAIVHQLPLYTRNPADYQYVPHQDLTIKVPYNYDAAATTKPD